MRQSSIFKIAILLLSTYLLTACMGLSGLSHKQVKVLKSEGFTYTDEGWLLTMPSRLLFATGEFELQAAQQESISELSQKLLKIKLEKMIVQGHTDNVGDQAFNLQLSEKRAQSVATVLINNGYQKQHINIIGYGSNKPLKANDSEENRSENRRVSIVVVP